MIFRGPVENFGVVGDGKSCSVEKKLVGLSEVGSLSVHLQG